MNDHDFEVQRGVRAHVSAQLGRRATRTDGEYVDSLAAHVEASLAKPSPIPEVPAKLVTPLFPELEVLRQHLMALPQVQELADQLEGFGFPEGGDALPGDEITFTNPLPPAYLTNYPPGPPEARDPDCDLPEGAICWIDADTNAGANLGRLALEVIVFEAEQLFPFQWEGVDLGALKTRIAEPESDGDDEMDLLEPARFRASTGRVYQIEFNHDVWLIPVEAAL